MKKLLIMAGALLAFTASTAMAAGQIHLGLGDCNSAAAAVNISNTCNSNSGSIVLVVSLISPEVTTQCVGFEAIVDAAQGGVLSDWWRSDPAGCNNGRVTGDANFTITGTLCNDIYAGAGTSGQGIFYPDPSNNLIQNNAIRLDVFAAVDAATPMTLDTSTENSLFHIVISKAHTVGGCAGCSTPTSLYLNDVGIFHEPGIPDVHTSGDGSGQGASYNGGNTVTPTKSTSWGSIKALYR